MKKPTYEEVQNYMLSKGFDNRDEAEKFVDHFDSIGWVVGKAKSPMKKWESAVNNWLKNVKRWSDDSHKQDYQARQRTEAARIYREMEQADGVPSLRIVR
tara:strand:- start:217 stop:516 length:300 start_codon:yes stop_codon:yes gene_type:complete